MLVNINCNKTLLHLETTHRADWRYSEILVMVASFSSRSAPNKQRKALWNQCFQRAYVRNKTFIRIYTNRINGYYPLFYRYYAENQSSCFPYFRICGFMPSFTFNNPFPTFKRIICPIASKFLPTCMLLSPKIFYAIFGCNSKEVCRTVFREIRPAFGCFPALSVQVWLCVKHESRLGWVWDG